MTAKILVVDDDEPLAEMIGIVLQADGFEAYYCNSGTEAISRFRTVQPDLVLLDVMLPGLSGIEICRRIRDESDTPIVMLTAKSDTSDVVAGLEAGADDYIPKPFKPKELVARVHARLRNLRGNSEERIEIGGLVIDLAAHEVKRGDENIQLTPLEFDLLSTLAAKPGIVFSREELLETVWGYRHSADTRLVNVHIQRLRSKIEEDPERPRIVITVRGVGYRAHGGR